MFNNKRLEKLEEKLDRLNNNLFKIASDSIQNDKLKSSSNAFLNENISIKLMPFSPYSLCHSIFLTVAPSYKCIVFGHSLNEESAETLFKLAVERKEKKRIEDIVKENDKLKKQLKKKGE